MVAISFAGQFVQQREPAAAPLLQPRPRAGTLQPRAMAAARRNAYRCRAGSLPWPPSGRRPPAATRAAVQTQRCHCPCAGRLSRCHCRARDAAWRALLDAGTCAAPLRPHPRHPLHPHRRCPSPPPTAPSPPHACDAATWISDVVGITTHGSSRQRAPCQEYEASQVTY